MKKVLTIAGFDGSGGAGIQADIKTFYSLGVHDISIVTSVTSQNSLGIRGKFDIDEKFLKKQLDTIFKDIKIDAVKIGMLSNKKIIKVVRRYIKNIDIPIVLDTPLLSSSGHILLEKSALKSLKNKLFNLSTLITPNIPEAEKLSGAKIKNLSDMKKVAKKLSKKYNVKSVLLKGGHLKRSSEAVDILYSEGKFTLFKEKKVGSKRDFRGTGCILSSAIAAYLAKGFGLKESITKAKKYITKSIKNSYKISKNGALYIKGCKRCV